MRILGMEFGSWSVKAVEMESRFRRIDVLDLHEEKLPIEISDPVAAYKRAVELLMAKLPSHPDKIVTSLPPAQTALRFLQLPIKQRKKVEQTYRFELEDNVPFKLDEAIIEHYVTRRGDGSLVFAAIAPKKHIHAHMEWLKAVGVDPDWLTFEGMGLTNLYLSAHAQPAEENTGPTLLLDIGHLKTNMAILDQGNLVFFRSIAWGGLSVSQAISVECNLSLEEAERKKINELRLDLDSDELPAEKSGMVSAAVQAFIPLFADLQHALVTFRSLYKQEVQSGLICGGTANTKGIQEFITKSLGVPTSLFEPFKSIKIQEEIQQPKSIRFGEALGRAMVYARNAALLFNFRRQDLAKGTSLTEVTQFLKNPNVVKLAQYLGVLAVILFVHVMITRPLAEKDYRAASEELKKVFADTFRNVPSKVSKSLVTDPQALKKYIDQKNVELEQKLKMLSKNRTPMLSLIRSISEAVPPTLRVDVNSLSIDDRSLLIDGVVYEGDINRMTEELKKVVSFSNVNLLQDGKRFSYRGEVHGR
ncbi:MAG: pilus assembly protein PilM [Deltaproteobacteria bacterium]|nr:pilus assembly protein PilM [Deltaproteobacteria bacterium]